MSFLDFLRAKGVIDADLHGIALSKGEDADDYVCEILVSNGEYDEEGVAKLRAEFFGLEYTSLEEFSKIDGINYEELEASLAIPFAISDKFTYVALSNPEKLETKNNLNYNLALCEKTRNTRTVYYIASEEKIKHKFQEITHRNNGDVEKIISDAIGAAASDMHITPFEKTAQIMFRIDGELTERKILNLEHFNQLVISTKVMAKLDISETRRPQSGHFQLGNADFRISFHPTYYGENVVVRILRKDKGLISINKIGFSPEQVSHLKKVCSFESGMLVFCGPTGSGKTTSIYSLIETMDKKSRNIMTLEDPVEYKIPDVRQTEILKGVIGFADGVRSILRQDPDVILIGEIRDAETAKMAIRASMTGHLVLTTVHANDSFGAIARFQEFGIPNSLIADNITTVISQRLVRKKFGGGRIVVAEILDITAKMKTAIYTNSSQLELQELAKREGFKTMADDCAKKIEKNLISETHANSVLKLA